MKDAAPKPIRSSFDIQQSETTKLLTQ